MGRRTTPGAVRAIGESFPSSANLDPYIDTASKLVDKVAQCDTDGEMDDQHLELLERWLAAHFYAVTRRPAKLSRKIGAASTTYHRGMLGKGYESSPYGQQALALDVTGCLRKLGRQKAGATWVGSRANDHAPYPTEVPPERDYNENE